MFCCAGRACQTTRAGNEGPSRCCSTRPPRQAIPTALQRRRRARLLLAAISGALPVLGLLVLAFSCCIAGPPLGTTCSLDYCDTTALHSQQRPCTRAYFTTTPTPPLALHTTTRQRQSGRAARDAQCMCACLHHASPGYPMSCLMSSNACYRLPSPQNKRHNQPSALLKLTSIITTAVTTPTPTPAPATPRESHALTSPPSVPTLRISLLIPPYDYLRSPATRSRR